MQVLDTDTLPARDRAEAFQTTVSGNCSSSMASFEDREAISAKMHMYELGSSKVFNIDATGTILRLTPRMAQRVDSCSIALALPMRTDNHMMWGREERSFGPRDMVLVDLSLPYVYGWKGFGASYAFHVDFDALGLPMDTIQTAARQLHTSPIYTLVRDHILFVTSQAHQLTDKAAAADVGRASAALMHALVVSAAGDTRRLEEAMNASLTARVQSYIRQHLCDPDLSPARIAAANNVSLRALYKLYESQGVSLRQSIVEQRLAGAREDLAQSRPVHVSIAATARAWGFSDASFFSKRFQQAFGMTPRRWQMESRSGIDGLSNTASGSLRLSVVE